MTVLEQRRFHDRCCHLLHRILVDLRFLARSHPEGLSAEEIPLVEELADIAHNIPLYLTGQDESVPGWLRNEIIRHVRKRWPQSDPLGTAYVRILDMDDTEFQMLYGQFQNYVAINEKKAG
jgi:hypothetical protein